MARIMSDFLICLLLSLYAINNVRIGEATPLEDHSMSNSINEYGSDLVSGLYKEAGAEDNILVSPVNSYAALALLFLGADGETEKKLAAVMKLKLPPSSETHHQQLKRIIEKLVSNLPDGSRYHETVLANGIFLQNDSAIRQTYLASTKEYYNALAKNVDFQNKAQESTDVINNWISEKTNGRIAKFYEESVSSDTIMVLVSALYFNAKWQQPFVAGHTKNEKFSTGIKEIEIPMMSKQTGLEYVTDPNLHFDSVTLPYYGRDYQMTVYLPHQGHNDSLAHLFGELARKNFQSGISSYSMVDLKLPKMKFAWKNSLVNALKLKEIFDDPNLNRMTSSKNVTISDMLHATELEVDEVGTIATAATAIQFSVKSARLNPINEPIVFHVNQPFLLTIVHKPTQVMLFAGIIRKPVQ